MTDLAQHSPIGWVRQRWTELSLARQFMLAGAAVLMAGMAVIGLWVTRQIEAGVTRNAATATALFVDSVIAPLIPDLRETAELSQGARRALDETLSRGALGDRLASFKIWKADGLIVYSNRPSLIGRRFEPTDNLTRALAGQVTADFDELSDEEDALEKAEGLPLLEVYSPIREPWSGEVVAVAEFYEIATDLQADIHWARLSSWIIVGLATFSMLAMLSGIVMHGSQVIAAQRQLLEARVRDLSDLLRQNSELRGRVERASRRAVALNEQYLRRISADLHDGPAQLLALASLKLGNAGLVDGAGAAPAAELDAIREHLDEAMREIREISRGLTLPQIERLELSALLRSAASAHERRTGTGVALTAPEQNPPLSVAEKICIYRFVQEGLTNAFRHAGGAGQSVGADVSGSSLQVCVEDQGSGLAVTEAGGLGLPGLRERIESLGGDFSVISTAGGTRLSMTLKLSGGDLR